MPLWLVIAGTLTWIWYSWMFYRYEAKDGLIFQILNIAYIPITCFWLTYLILEVFKILGN